VVVSAQASASDLKPAPVLVISSRMLSKSLVDLARRSRRVSAAIRSKMPGRSGLSSASSDLLVGGLPSDETCAPRSLRIVPATSLGSVCHHAHRGWRAVDPSRGSYDDLRFHLLDRGGV